MSDYAQIATRYAKALFLIAKESGGLSRVAQEQEQLLDAFAQDEALAKRIQNPALSRNTLEAAISAFAAKAGFSSETTQSLKLLAHNRRLDATAAVAQKFLDYWRANQNEEVAEVESIAPLSDSEQKTLEKDLSRALGKTVRLRVKINPELLGGLRVRIGSTLIDASIAGRLDRLALQCKAGVAA